MKNENGRIWYSEEEFEQQAAQAKYYHDKWLELVKEKINNEEPKYVDSAEEQLRKLGYNKK